ncbi:MAG: cobalt-precorrin-5B (C(1))-methyltransferase [Alphaproteobacteria bacterium]|nr:cobalt-precorrin-5B (C(1))-methyltransferase [Pseudomonadota bacterium]
MSRRPQGQLRKGWTTGACAAAGVHAAYSALLTGRFPDPVTIRLPKGQEPSFPLSEKHLDISRATVGIIKDAGDDPDVTDGARIVVTVVTAPEGTGVRFRAGAGVGTVTRPGLELSIGEPAINAAPRRMMEDIVASLAAAHGASGDVEITVSIPGGEALAEKTTNGRLGIVGGLSILGTTGIVIPYSCSSWIHSIHRGIDVARASGLDHVAASTGRTSEAAVSEMYGLDMVALIDMGDFAGGTLKYLRRHPVPWLTLAGGFAKIAKLAAGHLDLHSSRSSVDLEALGESFAALGAPAKALAAVKGARTAAEILALARSNHVPLADKVARNARAVALATLAGGIDVDVVIFDRKGELIGHAGP